MYGAIDKVSKTGDTMTGPLVLPAMQVTSGPANGSLLTSDASGNASWQIPGAVSGLDWVNVKTYGATGNGTTDDTAALQAALSAAPAGGTVYLPPGTYLVSSPLTVNGLTVYGANATSTAIRIAAGFSGSEAINLTGNGSIVQGLTVTGISTTYSSNPACDAIRITNAMRCTVRDVVVTYVNGWSVNVLPSGTGSCLWTILDSIHTYQVNQGIHILGVTGSGYNAGAYLVNCNVEQTAGGDGLLLEDAHDVLISNLEGWNLSTSTGNTLHIKGASAAVYLSGFSLGGLTSGTPQAHPVVLVESGSNGTPTGVSLQGGIIEAGTPGLAVTAGTQIACSGTQFFSNANYGVQISGSGPDVLFNGCAFSTNGYTAGASNFDAVVSATGGFVSFQHCDFITPGGSSSGQVASAVNANSVTRVRDCHFAGASAFGGGGGGYPKVARGNAGYNPVGPLTPPSIPSSGTVFSSPFGVDATVHVSGGTVSAIAIGGTATGLTAGTFRVPVTQSITLTYSAAPTWTWFGD
ncbi:glycoside hydrolase family 55 protein [Kitasatospora kifunensis]|nr:glycoside hydrolase family 55 protein [Kitasatospora kifunensis]